MTIAATQDRSALPRAPTPIRTPSSPWSSPVFGARPLDSKVAFRNLRMMRLLSRVGRAFTDAGIEVLLLKGAALNLTLYERPDERPMDDLDLLVRVEDVEAACAALEGVGGLRGKSQVREDFFPRFHYEIEYSLGRIYPVKIDLHVRPFRPLRYSQTVPDNALWEDAVPLEVGEATMLHPAPDDMLIHLTTHCAIHGNGRDSWLTDVARWMERYGKEIDWERFLEKTRAWRLTCAVLLALDAVHRKFGVSVPRAVHDALTRQRTSWRDRLTVKQAPLDAARPARHILVSALCTPSAGFVGSYLWAMAIPDRRHMEDWYAGRHPGWLPAAHVLRWCGPFLGKLPVLRKRFRRIEVKESGIHGVGVFARCRFGSGETIARYAGRKVREMGTYVVELGDRRGRRVRYALTGDVRFLNHSCNPNARIDHHRLVATRPIFPGREITIDYGPDACDCRADERGNVSPSAHRRRGGEEL